MTELRIPSTITLTDTESKLIKNAYPQYEKVLLEKEFGGGFSATRVFLALPVKDNGVHDARLVTKIGAAADLQREKDNYDQFAGPALPSVATQVKNCYPLGDQAAIHYVFAGGGAMGETLTLEDYYLAQPAEVINETLNTLLDKTLGESWYVQHKPYITPFRDEYGRHLPPHEKLLEIVNAIYPRLRAVAGERIEIPGVAGTYPNPLLVYPQVLDRTLKSCKSCVHGDLHVRNVLVDEGGRPWLIDFAKVKERHNLFDFIKLETYIRLMALAQIAGGFSLKDYAQFEQALSGRALPPANDDLTKAYQVIQNIREIAQKYIGHRENFEKEYFPALFLYSLSMLKYFHVNGPTPTQLMFITASVIAAKISDAPTEETMKPVPNKTPPTPEPAPPAREEHPTKGGISIGGNAKGNVIVNGDHNKVDQRNVHQRNVNTGGGAYVGGNVSVMNGDYVGRDKIIHSQNSTGSSLDELTKAFALIEAKAREEKNSTNKEDAFDAIEKLKKEANRGEQAEESRVERWFSLLAKASADAWDVAVATLSNPILGLGTAFQKIIQQAKEEKDKKK